MSYEDSGKTLTNKGEKDSVLIAGLILLCN